MQFKKKSRGSTKLFVFLQFIECFICQRVTVLYFYFTIVAANNITTLLDT